jgi:hypothetical protein
MARSRRTPATLVCRCSWELSSRELQRKKIASANEKLTWTSLKFAHPYGTRFRYVYSHAFSLARTETRKIIPASKP